MYLGPEIKFLVAIAMENCTDMYIFLALHAMKGQLTVKRNFDTGKKRVSWQPPILLVWLTVIQTMIHTFQTIYPLTMLENVTNQEKTNLELVVILNRDEICNKVIGLTTMIQDPMKNLVVKAVLDALRMKHKSGVSVNTFEDVLEYGKTLLFTSLGDNVDGDILSTLWPKSWNDVQLLLKEEGYEEAKQYFICFFVRKKNSQGMGRVSRSLFMMGSAVSWKTNMTGVLTVVMNAI